MLERDAPAAPPGRAAETTLIFREAHWPVPPLLAGVLPFKWAMLSRLTSALIPSYYDPSTVERLIHSVGKPLVWLWWRLVELLLIAQYGLESRGRTRLSMIPLKPIEFDAFGESVMLPRPDFYRRVRSNAIKALMTEIEEFTPEGVLLKTGAKLDLDTVVLATGWETDYSFVSDDVRSALRFAEDVLSPSRTVGEDDDQLKLSRQRVRRSGAGAECALHLVSASGELARPFGIASMSEN